MLFNMIKVISQFVPTELESKQLYWASVVCRKENLKELDEIKECTGVKGSDEVMKKEVLKDEVMKRDLMKHEVLEHELADSFGYEKMKEIVKVEKVESEKNLDGGMKFDDGEVDYQNALLIRN